VTGRQVTVMRGGMIERCPDSGRDVLRGRAVLIVANRAEIVA
jgi:hypothetical protein